MDMING